MKRSSMGLWVAVVVALHIGSPIFGADDAPADGGPLAKLAPFVGGEWHLDAKWANGEPLKARETFEWGLGKQFITTRTWVTNKDGTEY